MKDDTKEKETNCLTTITQEVSNEKMRKPADSPSVSFSPKQQYHGNNGKPPLFQHSHSNKHQHELRSNPLATEKKGGFDDHYDDDYHDDIVDDVTRLNRIAAASKKIAQNEKETMQNTPHVQIENSSVRSKSTTSSIADFITNLKNDAKFDASFKSFDADFISLENQAESELINRMEINDKNNNPETNSLNDDTRQEEKSILSWIPDDTDGNSIGHEVNDGKDSKSVVTKALFKKSVQRLQTLKDVTDTLRILQNAPSTENPGYLQRAHQAKMSRDSIFFERINIEVKKVPDTQFNTDGDIEAQPHKRNFTTLTGETNLWNLPNQNIIESGNADQPYLETNMFDGLTMNRPNSIEIHSLEEPLEIQDSPNNVVNHRNSISRWGTLLSLFQSASRRKVKNRKKRRNEMKNTLTDLFEIKRRSLVTVIKCLLIFFPLVFLVSYLLFYSFGNPSVTENGGSLSWWFLFLGFRQVLTVLFAKAIEIILIDLFVIRTHFVVRLIGPLFTLVIVFSRGWTFILPMWAILDRILYGLPWLTVTLLSWLQQYRIFTDENTSGLDNESINSMYMRILIAAIVAGVATSFKCLFFFLHFAKATHQSYGLELAKVSRKMILLSEVAFLAREIKYTKGKGSLIANDIPNSSHLWEDKSYRNSANYDLDVEDEDVDCPAKEDNKASISKPRSIRKSSTWGTYTTNENETSQKNEEANPASSTSKHPSVIGLSNSNKLNISDMLGAWEDSDPHLSIPQKASVRDRLQFRQSALLINNKFPFSPAFGNARTRKDCMESAQDTYEKLLLLSPGSDLLPFETISLIALGDNGEIDEKKIKSLIKLLRPNKDGNLSRLDFVKSCDRLYKRIRMLRAAIESSGKIDHAAKNLFNVVYYFLLGLTVLQICDLQPITLLVSLFTILLSVTFVVKEAASMYFEGILFILIRRPFDVGDRIHIDDVTDKVPYECSTWYVEDVTLFTTTIRSALSNMVASCQNGSLARSRIINAKRSQKAMIYVFFKFGVNVPYEKITYFRDEVESFVRNRPREWLKFSAFRPTRIESDLNYIEYVVVAQHTESWQNTTAILNSKAELMSFCLELSKRLKIQYSPPALPVNLEVRRQHNQSGRNTEESVRFAGFDEEKHLEEELLRNTISSFPDTPTLKKQQ